TSTSPAIWTRASLCGRSSSRGRRPISRPAAALSTTAYPAPNTRRRSTRRGDSSRPSRSPSPSSATSRGAGSIPPGRLIIPGSPRRPAVHRGRSPPQDLVDLPGATLHLHGGLLGLGGGELVDPPDRVPDALRHQ